MSELTKKLEAAGKQHLGTDLGRLLQWAAMHIQSQDEALAEVREELEAEQNERIRLERVIHTARKDADSIIEALTAGVPVNIELAKDNAPHINVMAYHGVEPYAKKPRKRKEAA